ncbi:Uncharacterized conserved secreted or membrane protein [marine gamma proteobacterium HTCC2207]|uniref:Uncharacterized conserved secreted or membrane protein n=1 Tax=gamma proteobacterium HTCC2207 TaxID=314287 RepID=Q1YP65_9GAMM|nr:Uncharacterized conserved secreted or membrane protein [marine gamma proteobacterium HTCC2207] [gamma proteobacterium HTCC2207]
MAEQVSGLYNGRVLVADQTEQSRSKGVNQALEQVLIKLTGNSKIMQLPGIQKAVSNTNNFIASVGYTKLPARLPADLSEEPANQPGFSLQVSFSAQAIDQLIRWAQLPILPAGRPKLVFWIVRDDAETGRQFVTEQQFPDFTQRFEQIMQDRALPYQLPELDLEDQLSLSVNEAWSMRNETIEVASQRYAADGWVLLRFFTTTSGQVRGSWTYKLGDQRGFDDVRAENTEVFVGLAVNELVDRISAQLTYVPQVDTSKLLVQINQVDSFADYQAVLAQLQSLKLVRSSNVSAVEGSRLFVTVDIDGGVDLLISALERSGRLVNQTSEMARFSGNLEFDWMVE